MQQHMLKVPGRIRLVVLLLALSGTVVWQFTSAWSSPVHATGLRGRPIIQNGTLVSDQGTRLRGATMELEDANSADTLAALDPNHWQQIHDLNLNVVRFDVKLSNATPNPVSLNDQLPYIDQAVSLAEQNNMYIQLMSSVTPGSYNLQELIDFWTVVADRYKDHPNVIYEQTNEPVAWAPNDYSDQAIADLKQVYDIMRSRAPQTPILLWTFAILGSGAGQGPQVINVIQKMTGIDYSKTLVAFHYYATDEGTIATVKSSYPVFMTETTNQGDDLAIPNLESAERLGVSWESLEGKWGLNTLQAIIATMHQDGYNWQADTQTGVFWDFETGNPQPTWNNTVDNGGYPAGGRLNVNGICCFMSGPQATTTSGSAHSGNRMLLYSGRATSGTGFNYAYLKSFDLTSQNIIVGPHTLLSYWIYPQSSASNSQVSGNNSSCVAIDLIFQASNGSLSNLRDSGTSDQKGNQAHPFYQCGKLTLDTWNPVVINLGTYRNGLKIIRLDIGYDQPGHTGGYRGYIDDIAIQ